MDSKIWLSSPHMGGSELKYIQDAFDQNWIAPVGPNINNFEADLENYLGEGAYAVALNSGTSAIHLGLILLGVGAGDEVICQSMTFSATVNPIRYLNATPIFVDSETITWNICPEQLEIAIKERIKKGKKPKAIIVVHLYGMPAQMDKIMSLSLQYAIPVLEDAAESLGSSIDGKKTGTFGEIAAISFNGNKIITTSGGGALISKKELHSAKAKFLATQAREDAPHYQHTEIGYNYRISNISAGIGRGQMEVVDKWIELRRDNFNFYLSHLQKTDGISFLEEPIGYRSNRWLTTILVEPHKGSFATKEQIRLALLAANIETRPLWKPMHLQPVFSGHPAYLNGNSEALFNYGLCLPSGSNLSNENLKSVVEKINFTNNSLNASKRVVRL